MKLSKIAQVTSIALCLGLSSMSVFVAQANAAETKTAAVAIDIKAQGKAFLKQYAESAYTVYSDSVNDLVKLQKAINAFVKKPTEKTLQAAKDAWLQSRESYGTTEVYRLSNGPIDAEEGWIADAYDSLEGQINPWPLDENMIDYTVDANGKLTSGNIIDNKGLFKPTGDDTATAVDVSKITAKVLTDLNENGGEANVSSGYHAIEFLLWGQDQDYNNPLEDKVTHGAMVAGKRPLSDFTTDKNKQRRLDYLKAATDKLLADVITVRDAFAPKVKGNKGLFRAALLGELKGKDADQNIPQNVALKQIFIGMGTFLKSELANERIAVAVLTPSEEDEHSCFSDNTHRDIAKNFEGFQDLFLGELKGKKLPVSLYQVLPAAEKTAVTKLFNNINSRIDTINTLARSTMHFDYQIMPKNEDSVKNIVATKNTMRKLGDKMVVVAKAYGINLTAEDVTDPEETAL